MQEILNSIENLGFSSISGVPDSTLSLLISSIEGSYLNKYVCVTPNEGSAIALAVGTFLGTGKPGLVYLQNSGLGNALNPLASLAHKDLFAIPMVLIIGWRGALTEKNVQFEDEPQHLIQGSITTKQLQDLQIPFTVASNSRNDFPRLLQDMFAKCLNISGPVAILVGPGLFDKKEIPIYNGDAEMDSKDVVELMLSVCDNDTIIVGSTGMISRELLKVKENNPSFRHPVFLNVGAMGHASMIAKGLAFTLPNKKIVCLDGDGALAMHLGSMPVLNNLENYVHVVINNMSHDSVGGQRTSFGNRDLAPLLNYFSHGEFTKFIRIDSESRTKLKKLLSSRKFQVIEFQCKPRGNHQLPRPTMKPFEKTVSFMNELGRTSGK
jgi:phosphonopyruvate decarboxylase